MSGRRTTPADITTAVIGRFDTCSDPRLRQIMQALVAHLHDFVVGVELTPDEWLKAIHALNATGEITDEHRQEFILWSDALGVSSLVDALAGREAPGGVTESTVLGPFYTPDAPLREYGESMLDAPSPGTPAWVGGHVRDTRGTPIADAELDLWQNDVDMLYTVQRKSGEESHLRGRYRTRADGSFAFITVRPVPYQVPDDGPVGRMLEATGRHPWRPAHIHAIVRADGYRTVVTHFFDQESEYLDSDTVFAVKPSLLRRFVERDADDPQRPPGIAGSWASMETEIVLASEDAGPP